MLTKEKVLLSVKFMVYFFTLNLNFRVPTSKNKYVIKLSPFPVDAGADSAALTKAKVCFPANSSSSY